MKIYELKRVRDWAQEKIDDGQEPPWAWFRYMQLIETLDKIMAGMNATTTLKVVDDNYQPEPVEVELPI